MAINKLAEYKSNRQRRLIQAVRDSKQSMQKQAFLSDFKLSNIPAAWKNISLGSPVLSAALKGGLIAGGSYLAAPYLAEPIIQGLTIGASPERAAQIRHESQKNMSSIRNRLALIGGLVGTAGSFAAGYNPKATLGQNLTEWSPVAKKEPVEKKAMDLGSFNSMMDKPVVPVHYAKQVINEDPLISFDQKFFLNKVFNTAEGGSGLASPDALGAAVQQTSQGIVMNPQTYKAPGGPLFSVDASTLGTTALQAATSYGAAKLAGTALGGIFGLGPVTTDVLSSRAGLVNALASTGIIGFH